MIIYKNKKITTKTISKIQCDVCKKVINCGNALHADTIERENLLRIRFTGGFGSIFGDGHNFTCDICQHCLEKKLGKYIKLDTQNDIFK